MDMNHYETVLAREEENSIRIQDPPEMLGRRGRTFGRGGSRRLTGGEIAENDLRRYDRIDSRMRVQSQQSNIHPSHRHPQYDTQSTSARISTTSQISDVIVVESWPLEEVQAQFNAHHPRPINLNQSSTLQIVHSPLNLAPRPIRRIGRQQDDSQRPSKRIRKET